MADKSLTRKTACERAAMIKSRAASPVEVLDAHLAVIARVNPKLNAIVTLAAEQAKERARAVEAAVMRGERLGALAGLPVAIKDVTPTAGIRTTFGSPLYKDHVPEEDAEAVRRLKAAGAIVLAKTNTPEFATGANTVNAVFGATRNPWNPALSPAGSSGGSAVAVATGMVADRAGNRFRLLDPNSGGVLRHRRDTADARPDPQSSDAAVVGSGPSARSAGAHGRGRGARARRNDRLEPPLADLGCATLVERVGGGGPLQGRARVARRLCVGHCRNRGRCRDRRHLPASRTAIAGCRRGRRGDRVRCVRRPRSL